MVKFNAQELRVLKIVVEEGLEKEKQRVEHAYLTAHQFTLESCLDKLNQQHLAA